MAGREPPGPPREGRRAAFSGFSLWEPQQGVSRHPAPATAPSGGSPSPRQLSAGRGRTGRSPGAAGSQGGHSSPVPLGSAAPDARTAAPWVLGTPRARWPGTARGSPSPWGSPPPPGPGEPLWLQRRQVSPSQSPPQTPLHPLSCPPGLLLGPAKHVRSPRGVALGPPPGTRGTWGRRRRAEVAGWLRAGGSSHPGGRGFLQQTSPTQHPWSRAHREPCAGTPSPGWDVRGRGPRGSQRAEGLHLCLETSASQSESALNPSLPPSLARNFSR